MKLASRQPGFPGVDGRLLSAKARPAPIEARGKLGGRYIAGFMSCARPGEVEQLLAIRFGGGNQNQMSARPQNAGTFSQGIVERLLEIADDIGINAPDSAALDR
jgi:hypothetical protein